MHHFQNVHSLEQDEKHAETSCLVNLASSLLEPVLLNAFQDVPLVHQERAILKIVTLKLRVALTYNLLGLIVSPFVLINLSKFILL
jgi:hypothetical protein